MTESRKRLATSVECKPVAYDRSIRQSSEGFILTLRIDGESIDVLSDSLVKAQALMNTFPPEVYHGLCEK
jgi:hypothetical protein